MVTLHRARRHRLLLTFTLLSLAGCDSAFSPEYMGGSFALVAVGDSPLPYVDSTYLTRRGLPPATHVVIADTVEFGPSGRGIWRSVSYQDWPDELVGDTVRLSLPFRYLRSGTSVTLLFEVCQPQCEGFHQERIRTIDSAGLVRDRNLRRWRYERVAGTGAP